MFVILLFNFQEFFSEFFFIAYRSHFTDSLFLLSELTVAAFKIHFVFLFFLCLLALGFSGFVCSLC